MLELESSDWKLYSHANGDASNLPDLISRLKQASAGEWEAINEELTCMIVCQGDVYSGTYAVAPHLVQYAAELGPCSQSDAILATIASASIGPGPEVPEALEESWEDAQDDAREIIVDRFVDSQVSRQYAGELIAGLLILSAEWSAGRAVEKWIWGYGVGARCDSCTHTTNVSWNENTTKQTRKVAESFWRRERIITNDVFVEPTVMKGIPPEIELEFDESILREQIVGLAVASQAEMTEKQIRCMFGTAQCGYCKSNAPMPGLMANP